MQDLLRKITILLISSIITSSSFCQIKQDDFKIFDGKITRIDSITFDYDDKVLFVINTPEDLINIFNKGILYPEIITNCANEIVIDTEVEPEELDTNVITIVYKGNKSFNSIFGCDSLTISDLKEVKAKGNLKNIKKFSFLLFRNGLANPTEYYFELINNETGINMDLKTFIKGSRLRKIVKGSVQI